MKNTENGRSMIEMLGVLAIIGVLSVGGIAGYSKAMMKYRINKTIEQITLIAGNLRSFFRENYSDARCFCSGSACTGIVSSDGCPIYKKAKLIPEEMLTIDSNGKITSIINEFGGSIKISSGTSIYGLDKKNFAIEYEIISPEACIELLTSDWTVANFPAMGITTANGEGGVAETPWSINDASTYCDKAKYISFYSAISLPLINNCNVSKGQWCN